MDSGDEAYAGLLDSLLPSSSFQPASSSSSTARLQKAVASLHAAALQSTESPGPHLEYLAETLSALSLPEPIILHPTPHSANTQALLSQLRNAKPSILHVHSPAHKPSFPHHLHCTEAFLPLSSHTEAASLIASSLRDAVSAREPVTLIVLHLNATNSLLPALPVAYALADRFNGRVHTTGPGCFSAFRGVPLATHSVGIDLGGALGIYGCGHITFGVEEVKDGYAHHLLPFAVCTRYVLEKLSLQSIRAILNGVVRVVEGISDALYRVEELWKVDTLAEGEVRIRYGGEDSKEVEQAAVDGDESGLLELSDGVLISAISALRRHHAPPENTARVICESLIRVAREYELAKLARSAFTARLRQCEHVEAQPGEGMVLCVFSVVPLGHVPPAGRWRKDEDAWGTVEKCTKRFVDAKSDLEVVAVMMGGNGNDSRPEAMLSPRLNGSMEEGKEAWRMADECERLAQELLFDETSARSWGVRVADGVVQTVVRVVDEIGVADDREVREEIQETDEEIGRGPDGTVEIVQAKDSSRERDQDEEVGVEENIKDKNDDDAVRTRDEGFPFHERKPEWVEGQGEPGAQVETNAKTTVTAENDARQRSRPGLWGFIFGDDAGETESEESYEDVDGKQLEDDYFRP